MYIWYSSQNHHPASLFQPYTLLVCLVVQLVTEDDYLLSGCSHSGTVWRCFRNKLKQDCPELINDFDELLNEVVQDYEEQEKIFE